jgi:2'-5' RNA ligase
VSGAAGRRLFLAVGLDYVTRHLLAACLGDQLEMSPAWRPVRPENWHLTLRFLGWTTEVQRDLVMMHLAEQLEAAPFAARLDALGAFPKPRKATVLWMGVDAGDRLAPLAAAAESAAVAAGFAPEDRPYHAHLTLARIRPQTDVRELVEGFDACGVRFEVNAVTMYESFVVPGGTRYEPIDTIPLRPVG